MPAENHDDFLQPRDPAIVVWRYMDFTKYVSMLERSALFLSRLDLLGDPFEGSTTSLNVAAFRDALLAHGFSTADAQHASAQMSKTNKEHRKIAYVNCWHMNFHESVAMWKIYARSAEAIAIHTTYEKLRDHLDGNCFLGVVKYIDYDQDWIGGGTIFRSMLSKRKSFEYEHEARVIKLKLPTENGRVDLEKAPPGIMQKVDIQSLIDGVCVAPNAPSWYRQLVESLTQKYEFSFPIQQSKLDAAPVF